MTADASVLAQARLFAALSGTFLPTEVLRLLPKMDPGELVMAATDLASVCDTSPAGAETTWLMRAPARNEVLGKLDRAELTRAIAERMKASLSEETADLLNVLSDTPPLDEAGIRAIIAAREDRRKLERAITALDRAGVVASAHKLLQPARAALAEYLRSAKLRRVEERGFFGRDAETSTIASWLSRPVLSPPVTCLFVTGAPGLGKSTLLAESVRRFSEKNAPLVLRLDFDRAGLDVLDQVGLTMEAARQLADQLPEASEALAQARLDAGRVLEQNARQIRSNRQRLPIELARTLGSVVADAQRSVLVVLDTLEVLRGRGETHPETLFRWLDSLVARGLAPMHVLAAGRGDALDSLGGLGDTSSPQPATNRPARVMRVQLSRLEDDAAVLLLQKSGAPKLLHPELLQLGQGNPLKLRLAAELALRSGPERLPRRRRGKELDAAFLYRMLLSRIDEPQLKRLAHPGLIVRRINAAVIERVLAPTLGLGPISPQKAFSLMEELATHHWLVEPDPGAPGYLKHRSDMRALLLPMLYRSAPRQSARVDAAARQWFAQLDAPWAQVEAAYHLLQLSRVPKARTPEIQASVALQFDGTTLEELPAAAADMIRRLRGERTSQFRGAKAAASGDDPGMARELIAMVQRQDWREGQHFVRSLIDGGRVDPSSESADAIRTFLWRSGQWGQARQSLVERDRYEGHDSDLANLPEEIALARLEMRAHFAPEALRRQWWHWRPILPRLERAAASGSDSAAREGALGLLCAQLPDPFHFARIDSQKVDIPVALEEKWGSDRDGPQAQRALELGSQYLSRLLPSPPQLGESRSPGRLLATLTPYPAFAANLALMEGKSHVDEAAALAAQTIALAGGLLGVPSPQTIQVQSVAPITWLAGIGLFAEWVVAHASQQRDQDLRVIGLAAERWRRTAAGHWSIGRPRGAWRRPAPLDDTLRLRLENFLRSGRPPVQQAYEELQVWERALAARSLVPRLKRRLQAAVAALGERWRDDPHEITRWLLARGVPAAFAPALAVLVTHREL